MGLLNILNKAPEDDLSCMCGVYGLEISSKLENACRLYKWADTIQKQIELIENLKLCVEGDILNKM